MKKNRMQKVLALVFSGALAISAFAACGGGGATSSESFTSIGGTTSKFDSDAVLYTDGLNYKTTDNLPYGTSWNAKHNYTDGMNVTSWVATNIKSIQIVRTIEFPFAYSNGELVYPNKLRKFGHGMARALRAYAEGEVLVSEMPQSAE